MSNEGRAVEKEKIKSAYDVVIIGAGPAGMFAAYELAAGKMEILLLYGRTLIASAYESLSYSRLCPVRDNVRVWRLRDILGH